LKKKIYVSVCLVICVLLSGCGNEIPQMTDEQQNMIAEYATGTLLKYSGNYHDKMIRRENPDEAEPADSETDLIDEEESEKDLSDEHLTENAEIESKDSSGENEADIPDDVPAISANDVAAQPSFSLPELLQTPGFSVEYDGYEICDAYSGADEGELAFEMTASAGRKLLVLKFLVTNVSGQDQFFDVFSQSAKVKVTAAGETQGALLTMLDNDLLTASANMGAGETATYVVVVQVKEESTVDSIQMSVNCQGNTGKYLYE